MTKLPKLHDCTRHPLHPAINGRCLGCFAETAKLDDPKAQPAARAGEEKPKRTKKQLFEDFGTKLRRGVQ